MSDLPNPTDVPCFHCGKQLKPAMRGCSPWEGVSGGVLLDGGGSFGSTLYDTLMDGIGIRIALCDHCLHEREGMILKKQVDKGKARVMSKP